MTDVNTYYLGNTTNPMNILERFWSKVEKTDNCWNWKGASGGRYGRFNIGDRKMVQTHRFAYELTKGQIPEDKVIDHLCKNIKCCNPDHLDIVTQKENIMRSNNHVAKRALSRYCIRNHPLFGKNLLLNPKDGRRLCRECYKIRKKKWGGLKLQM